MKRRPITDQLRERVFEAAGRCCHICGGTIDPRKERWDVEHVRPLSMGGADDETNMRPAHVACHAEKSAAEAKPRAKAIRMRAKALGMAKRSARKLQSAGFQPSPPQRSASRPLNNPLPPRRLA